MNITISDTSSAIAEASSLLSVANSYKSILNTLNYTKVTLNEVWESGNEVDSINTSVDNCLNEYNNKILPALKKLANGTIAYCVATEELAASGATNSDGEIYDSPSEWVEDNPYSGYTETSEYDLSNLNAFLLSYEGAPMYDSNNYKVYTDSDGSLTAGPGLHLNNYNLEQYVITTTDSSGNVVRYIDKSKVDVAYSQCVAGFRNSITDCLKTEKYSNITLNDAQVDSLTSLLYNTGKNPEYFLDKYVEATNSGTTLYEHCTKNWVTDGTTRLEGLARRRKAEAVLFEKGYDAYYEFMKTGVM